jgi:hypothetical protein
MHTIPPNNAPSYKGQWAMLIYLGLCFYCYGTIMMVYFVVYPSTIKLTEQFKPIINSFNKGMPMVCYIPVFITVLAAGSFYWFNKHVFPRWIFIASILLTLLLAGTTIFFIAPIHYNLSITGLTGSTATELLQLSFNFQIIPATLQILLALIILNAYFQQIRIVGRWLFILVFALSFYNAGTGFVDMFIFYQNWSLVSETDWLPYRLAKNEFFKVFLIPTLIPFVLTSSLFQFRLKELPRHLVLIIWAAVSSIVFTSIFYFVPKIQVKLNSQYSLPLIEDLINYSFLFWLPAVLLIVFIAGKIFIITGRQLHQNK